MIIAIGIVSAMTPALCKDADGYYSDCDMVHGCSSYRNIDYSYYHDYSNPGNYDFGKLSYCRDSRGEYYYCYKKYNNYDGYDDYYYYNNYYDQQYNDRYGNVIKITRPSYTREYCYWVGTGVWGSRRVCSTNDDGLNNPYYPDTEKNYIFSVSSSYNKQKLEDYYKYMNTQDNVIVQPIIYVR